MRQPNSVYVIGNPGTGLVKIGIAVDVDRRIIEIMNGYVPIGLDRQRLVALRVYGTVHARALEYALHHAFPGQRMVREGMKLGRGAEGMTEWFELGLNALARVDVSTWLWTQRTGHRVSLLACSSV